MRGIVMGTLIGRLRDRISYWPFLSFLCGRKPFPEQPEAEDEVTFRFKDCGDDSEPSAEEIEAKQNERTEQFKRDQILPVMGMVMPR
jgi:hypothetical protein